jgi:hypothetical protein
VLVIGDAPPNTAQEVIDKRQGGILGESYWSLTNKFAQKRVWSTEVNRLVDRNVPIHTFYVDKRAKKAFEEIARLSNGTSQVTQIIMRIINNFDSLKILLFSYFSYFIK